MAVSQDLATLKAIARRLLGPHDVTVYLFGSQALQAARRASDIDLAVEPGARFPDRALADFREAIEESDIVRRVDVVDLRDTAQSFRNRVRREGKLWIGARKN